MRFLFGFFILMPLLIAGCASDNFPEREIMYCEAKQVYQHLRKEDTCLQLIIQTESGLTLNEAALIKHDEIFTEIYEAFFQMQQLSLTSSPIYKDFMSIKEDYNEYHAEWPSRLKQAIDQIIATRKGGDTHR